MFVDSATINIKSGRGGNGVNCFYSDKLTRHGHPDGGDGGLGGNVIIRVSADVHTLLDFRYRQHFKAKDGKHGSGKKKKGADGEDCIIRVPAGTLIYEKDTNALIVDLIDCNEEFIIAEGGNSGKGNRTHKNATDGTSGQEVTICLELKLIADVGLIGLPNSGKSTFITKITNAHPKIAAYPFTTKSPVLGVVREDDFEFKIAEIPGLIKDAHKGKGLGDLFLRHIERTRLLVHLMDISKVESDPYLDYQIINEELELYKKGVSKKKRILAANKMDLPEANSNLRKLAKKVKDKIYPISCKTGEGIELLMDEIKTCIKMQK